jgi:hypothetical protein
VDAAWLPAIPPRPRAAADPGGAGGGLDGGLRRVAGHVLGLRLPAAARLLAAEAHAELRAAAAAAAAAALRGVDAAGWQVRVASRESWG